MNYKFSKEQADEYPDDKPYRELMLYKVIDDNDQIVGQFYFYRDEQYFVFDNTQISIEVISKLFKKTKYNLLNNNKPIGNYEIFGGGGIDRFYQDVPSNPTATINIGDQKYNFRRIPAAVEYSFFKQETWGYFKFRLYAVKGNEFYDYSLKMDIPFLSKANYTKYRPFVGQIESNSDNMLVMLAGIYLMDIEFEYEDTKNAD
jgi:hypothetical protein